jgi:citrate lyase subunit beta/citryl-CoA lyase
MKNNSAESGNLGNQVRSDCWVQIQPTVKGDIELDLVSKVSCLYEDSIRKDISEMVDFFKLRHARIKVVDMGALSFVIKSRVESAIRKAGLDKGKRYLPETKYELKMSSRERPRRSRLYLPGNQPKLFLNAAVHQPDALILDLEDSVSVEHKLDARVLVKHALCSVDFKDCERMVRINQLPLGLEDVEELLEVKPNLLLIPKVEEAEQILELEERINTILKNKNIGNMEEPYFMPIIESAGGVIKSFEIATSSKRIVALAIGLEDYTADIGCMRTKEGLESFFARSMIINAAKAAGIQAIDTVFSDIADMEGLRTSVREAKMLGFDGKGCIHPRQIAIINQEFLPSKSELQKAKQIVKAFEEAREKGLSVVSLGSKMIDPPVVKRALRVIKLSLESGKIKKNWRNGDE